MAELKKCPCCGSDDVQHYEMMDKIMAGIVCMECGLNTTDDRYGEKWNTRADDWISADKNEPKYSARAGGARFVHLLLTDGFSVGEGMYIDGHYRYLHVPYKPTHFMYLPEPPKGAGE